MSSAAIQAFDMHMVSVEQADHCGVLARRLIIALLLPSAFMSMTGVLQWNKRSVATISEFVPNMANELGAMPCQTQLLMTLVISTLQVYAINSGEFIAPTVVLVLSLGLSVYIIMGYPITEASVLTADAIVLIMTWHSTFHMLYAPGSVYFGIITIINLLSIVSNYIAVPQQHPYPDPSDGILMSSFGNIKQIIVNLHAGCCTCVRRREFTGFHKNPAFVRSSKVCPIQDLVNILRTCNAPALKLVDRFTSITLSRFFLNLRQASQATQSLSNLQFGTGVGSLGGSLAFIGNDDDDGAQDACVDTIKARSQPADFPKEKMESAKRTGYSGLRREPIDHSSRVSYGVTCTPGAASDSSDFS
ncbi:hypothetical protein DAEQUDRAFT_760008 [Daedalea quercina L-15889]|uniref:Uncharacterized protein n=1 Tax=Daedalea quercina L-15889 TaxID=1314783 RepID=A0A165LEE5_9APHY|nr:hypothetical protein DAEQUDRAFT_760008 [Daedalea quercina L-15889]